MSDSNKIKNKINESDIMNSELLDYLKLYNFIEFLYTEEVLTSKTAEEMVRALITFKKYAYKDLQ